MGPTGFVKALDISAKRSPRLGYAGIDPQVDLLVVDGPPEPFHENIVPRGPLAIHADRDLVMFQQLREGQARELRPLIRVGDLGLAVFCQCLRDSLNAKACVARNRELPGQDLPAEPINDGSQIGGAACHGDIGDVHCPDLVGAQDRPPEPGGRRRSASPADAERLGLFGQRQGMLTVNHCFSPSNPALVSAPAKESFVSVNSPIFARRSFTSTGTGASGLPSPISLQHRQATDPARS